MPIEMELITSEVILVRAALRLRAREVLPAIALAYQQLADQLEPIGLYQFEPTEAVHACLALKDFSDICGAIDLVELSVRAQDLSDDFLRGCFAFVPLEEACRLMSQATARQKEGVRHKTQPTGFVSRLAAAVGIASARVSS